jgi:hypothetical protein
MKINVDFSGAFDRAMFTAATILLLFAAFILGRLTAPGTAFAEWDSSSAFGDSYSLEEVAAGVEYCADRLSEISRTLEDIERAMP